MNPTIWAKTDQSYEEHITNAYHAWKDTVTAKKNLIQRFCNKFGFSEERFLKSSLLTVVLHDIGKNTTNFQQMIVAKQKGEHFDYRKNYRHELVSFLYAIAGNLALSKQEHGQLIGNIPLEAMAILGHHKKINPTMASFDRESGWSGANRIPAINKEGAKNALLLAKEIFTKEEYEFPEQLFDFNAEKYDPYKNANKFLNISFIKLFEKEPKTEPETVRATYLLLKAILHYADWHCSAGSDVNYALKTHSDDLFNDIEKRCKEKQIKFDGLLPFQDECANSLGHIIAVAPTGSGKTEASLLWALNNLQDLGGGKLIYLLPTMVTANSIFERLEDYFGKGNIGLTHSTATFMFQDEEDNSENIRNVLFDKTFIKPATVATIDQLLATGFNTGKWTLIEANAANSVIIIDEIHSYDSWTLGLIMESLKHFSNLGARFMLMSATLPEYLINLFSDALPDVNVIRDKTLLKSYRNRYKTFEKYIDDAIPEIEQSVNDGKKTLVVVNNVAKCQELYGILERLNPICYHSKFILKDRMEKEKHIDDSLLLIATQVVEVSLDIDFDVMFTECAPPDAIAQRAGRVNRRRTKSDSYVFIYKPSKTSKLIYDPDSSGLLERSFQEFENSPEEMTESKLIKIVEKVYSNIEIESTENFKRASEQYSNTQERLKGIFDNLNRDNLNEITRKTEYRQLPVIPSTFKDEVLSLSPSKRRLYEVKMPYWYVLKHKEHNDIFCNMEYDSKIGATSTEDNEVSTMII